MTTQQQRQLPINPEEVWTLMEDLGVDEDVARGMLAVRLGLTDHVVARPRNGAGLRLVKRDRLEKPKPDCAPMP